MMTGMLSTPLTLNEKYLLDEYLGTREQRKGLNTLIKNMGYIVPRLYRGTMYLLEDVKVGNIYQHWNSLSSWSTEEQVAIQFALAEYVPEEFIDIMVRTKKFSLQDSNDIFVPIVLFCDNVKGFVVNHHYKNQLYEKEYEVIVYDTKFEIESIEEVFFENKLYYKVFCQALD